jgi:hypothetical protein
VRRYTINNKPKCLQSAGDTRTRTRTIITCILYEYRVVLFFFRSTPPPVDSLSIPFDVLPPPPPSRAYRCYPVVRVYTYMRIIIIPFYLLLLLDLDGVALRSVFPLTATSHCVHFGSTGRTERNIRRKKREKISTTYTFQHT